MKAKELAQSYKDEPTHSTLSVILIRLITESYEIAKARNASDCGLPAILDEQERKWKAVVRELPVLQELYQNPDSLFVELVRTRTPEVYDFWKAPKKKKG